MVYVAHVSCKVYIIISNVDVNWVTSIIIQDTTSVLPRWLRL